MLFHQLYDFYESHHLTGPTLYTWLIRCSLYFISLKQTSGEYWTCVSHQTVDCSQHCCPLVAVNIVKNSQPIRAKPPVRIHVPSTACDVITFNGQVFVRLLVQSEEIFQTIPE